MIVRGAVDRLLAVRTSRIHTVSFSRTSECCARAGRIVRTAVVGVVGSCRGAEHPLRVASISNSVAVYQYRIVEDSLCDMPGDVCLCLSLTGHADSHQRSR